MTELEGQTIDQFKSGDQVTSFFIVRKIELKTKRDGGPYLVMGLGDATGHISGTAWDNAKQIHQLVTAGDIVKIQGTVGTYNEALQLTVHRIRKAEATDGVSLARFLPQAPIDVDAIMSELKTIITSVQEPSLKKLLDRIFDDSAQNKRFLETPGGKLWHHAYLGGLLEHTLAVATVCETMATLYPTVNRDLLITGALLHDIGKLDEYGFDQGFIDFTEEGRLWGHISIGAQKIRALIESIEEEEGFPTELKKQVVHLILSHQGELEHGSPVLPQTLEAMILYYADEMDSKANALNHIIERDSEPGRVWSQYIKLLDRFIYLKKIE